MEKANFIKNNPDDMIWWAKSTDTIGEWLFTFDKTTVFNMLTGVYEPTEGNIVLDGNDITGATPEAISKAGIARTFQNIRLFNDMTVLDNVKVGLHNQVVYGMWTGILRLPSFREKEHEMDRRAMKLLKIFDLDAEANYKASQLPYGKQRKLEIARALATNPKLLLLDEPAAGMNPNETEELMNTIHSVRDQFGVAILLIEHDMNFVMGICEEITVLDYGRVIARGDGKTIRNNPKVIAAYLGELLSVKNINVYYGSIHAIKDVSFHVDEGEIVTLIGANGAGKTTTMHAISGLLKLASGEITYDGNLISKMEAHKIVRLGLAQVPEGRRVFSGLTVQQNLSMGAYTRHDGKDAIQSDYDMVFDLLPRLKERRNQPAGTLSGGEQQMLAVGRALMCKPKILLLDEPSMGLSPLLVKEIFKIIRDINRQGVTVLLVEQNAKMALDIANRAYVLETGTIKMEGEATELANNIEVRKAYLGCE